MTGAGTIAVRYRSSTPCLPIVPFQDLSVCHLLTFIIHKSTRNLASNNRSSTQRNSLCPTNPFSPTRNAHGRTYVFELSGCLVRVSSNKKVISGYTKVLQQAGLTVSMSPDDDFEGGDIDDDEG